jgi:hypothetical protein
VVKTHPLVPPLDDARLSDPGRAHEALARIGALYAVEMDARARNITGIALAAHR